MCDSTSVLAVFLGQNSRYLTCLCWFRILPSTKENDQFTLGLDGDIPKLCLYMFHKPWGLSLNQDFIVHVLLDLFICGRLLQASKHFNLYKAYVAPEITPLESLDEGFEPV